MLAIYFQKICRNILILDHGNKYVVRDINVPEINNNERTYGRILVKVLHSVLGLGVMGVGCGSSTRNQTRKPKMPFTRYILYIL